MAKNKRSDKKVKVKSEVKSEAESAGGDSQASLNSGKIPLSSVFGNQAVPSAPTAAPDAEKPRKRRHSSSPQAAPQQDHPTGHSGGFFDFGPPPSSGGDRKTTTSVLINVFADGSGSATVLNLPDGVTPCIVAPPKGGGCLNDDCPDCAPPDCGSPVSAPDSDVGNRPSAENMDFRALLSSFLGNVSPGMTLEKLMADDPTETYQVTTNFKLFRDMVKDSREQLADVRMSDD